MDLSVPNLGISQVDTPLADLVHSLRTSENYVDEDDRVLFDDTLFMLRNRARAAAAGSSAAATGSGAADERALATEELPGFEPAGPRRKIFFDPSKIGAGIVTCGGLCPGFNDVIRALVLQMSRYGVRRIWGFRNGYQGFIPKYRREVINLTAETVSRINEYGGTILGTSRGEQDPEVIVDCLEQMGVNVLFVIGGDGSMRGAARIAEVIAERGRLISIIGVPKTIDNDIPYIDQSFGFQTAFTKATEAIRAAQVEATAVPHGVGLVQLMGRHSGFVASYAALGNNDADYVLIPEVPVALDGDDGFLAHLHAKVLKQGNAVVVVAEGAGQEYLRDIAPRRTDASGNEKLHDFGVYLRRRIDEYFTAQGSEVNLKYIDPSYAIRSVPANPYDSSYCIRLAQAAAHAGMAGRTAMVVGRWHGRYVHVPISLAVSKRNQVDPDGDLWLSVLETTGQPPHFGEGSAV